MKRIVLVSDCSDVAYNEMRATILSELDKLSTKDVEIEPLVKAEEFSIINGSFLLRLMAECYNPKDTIFLVILNPLKTNVKERARIIGELNNGVKFVGANTGALNWLIEDFGLKSLYELNAPGLTGREFISFGGKYVHSPAAAKIASGIAFDKLGTKKNKDFLINFSIKEGTVVHIDNFGVSKIRGKMPELKEGENTEIYVNEKKIGRGVFTHCMKDLPDGTLAIYPGSSLNNLPEIGKVRCLKTAKQLKIQIGDIVTFKKIQKDLKK
jgi:S-adenosylmethionine hydrolase